MPELLLHNHTKQQLDLIIKSPPHAILITGPAGSGKRSIANYLSAMLLDIPKDKLTEYPYFMLIERSAGRQEISIDTVRELTKKLNLRPVIGAKKPVNRVVLIDEAHLSSAEAQNALLKAIEEPPAGTVFILTAISDAAVLPTIASRSQKLRVGIPSLEEAIKYFSGQYDMPVIKSAWQLSDGAAGLMNAILKEDINHKLKQSVETAKKLLSLSRYERALLLDELGTKKEDFAQVLDALGRVLAALHRSAIANKSKNAAKIMQARKQVDQAIAAISLNTSAKLVALNLALSLPL